MKILISLLFLLGFGTIWSQVNGLIQGNNGKKMEPLYGAKVKLLLAKKGVVTGEEGLFEMVLPKDLPDTMVISARGYISDTVVLFKNILTFRKIFELNARDPEFFHSVRGVGYRFTLHSPK